MNSKVIQLSLISKYRQELMGIATILILVCHSVGNNVYIPFPLNKLFALGTCGVDIFFFLSGFGLYYSLQKKKSILQWYKKRYIRILVPYLIISIIGFVDYCINQPYDFGEYLFRLSLLSFWTDHNVAWFLAVIIPFYAITPFLYQILFSHKHTVLVALGITVSVIAYNILQPSVTDGIVYNINYALPHFIPFVWGFIAADKSRSDDSSISILFPVAATIVAWGEYFLNGENAFLFIGCASAIVPLSIYTLQFLNCDCKVLRWFGKVSLESYLTNTNLPVYLKYIPFLISGVGIAYGNYLFYTIVVVVGLLWAWLANYISNIIIKRIYV